MVQGITDAGGVDVSRGMQKFKHSDVVRAIKAARAAGEKVSGFEVALDGRIIVRIGDNAPPLAPGSDPDIEAYFAKLKRKKSDK